MTTSSILNSTKKVLGIEADYTQFDVDIMMHINSAFSTLNQLGIGPVNGFMIEDDLVTWDAFLLGDDRLNSVKTYTYLKVRLLFDPPTTSYTTTSMQEQIKELEWRLNVVREGSANGEVPLGSVLDGGGPSDTNNTSSNDNVLDGGSP